ncbi:MAG: serine/threonine-protein kinase [Clostridiales bacterium]|jgi:serine/threonine protein kinase|nr:serine/threonine-protein kinase [Eubacteriales bacterium]MDH7566147.1 serine/threonine-protein kinase [Clostridiales bacterium]
MRQGQLFEGKYRILKVLGQGGMSRVYLAENVKLGTLWSIKEIGKKPGPGMDLLVEPNILKKLSHPALPRVFDVVEDSRSIYIIEDYIEGSSLDKELASAGKFPEDQVVSWAKQICGVLTYLHNFKPNPIIYRDLKPSNIILTGDGSIKLIDFGIAREYKAGSDSDTIYIGTRGYAAPEQYGIGQTNPVTDIYSLGITLHHLLTGKSPNEPPYEIKPVRYFDKSLSAEIEAIIEKCTRFNPEERYQTAAEVLQDIESIGGQGGNAVVGEESPTGLRKEGSGRRVSFKKLVLTMWDSAEFGCEFAYLAARLTNLEIFLIDLDLLAPSCDIHLNLPRHPQNIISDHIIPKSGLNIVMDSIDKNLLTAEILAEASVVRKDVKNLHVLTGSYSLENYEYFSDSSLIKLIEKAYQSFDVTILLVNRSIYDSYTLVSLVKSDYNIIALRADMGKFREFNRYLMFLKEKQNMPLNKTKYVAYEYNGAFNLGRKVIMEITEQNFLGSVRYSDKRARCRNLKASFVKRMDGKTLNDYMGILSRFDILAPQSPIQKLKRWSAGLKALCRSFLRLARIKAGRRLKRNARGKYAS